MAMINLDKILQAKFGFKTFKTGQKEILTALLAQQSTLAILPTGGGKTLIYQMMGAVRDGLVIIVTPLLSLMQDQVARLNYLGEKNVIALNSTLTFENKKNVLKHLKQYHFLFISPEMLNQEQVQIALKQVPINLMVIDEVHTMVTWGQDFRPDYLALPAIHKQLDQPQLLLLTATATPSMITAIIENFRSVPKKWFVYQQPVDRPNIFLHTEQLANELEKKQRLKDLLQTTSGPGVVYFTSRKLATSMAEWLTNETGQRVVAYHAGMTAMARYRVQQQFMQGEIDVITATSAFGMGIDKENIRFVIHYHLSNDLSNYLQEIGRAGRDGQQSAAILLYVPGDESIQFNLIDQTIPDSYAIKSYVEQSEVTILTPEQIRLLDFYKSNQLTTVEISRIFDNRRRIRQNNLLSMINYVKSDGQLRYQISDYFGNETDGLSQTDESVGVTDWHPKELHLERKEDGKHQLKVLNWSEQLKKLFNLQ